MPNLLWPVGTKQALCAWGTDVFKFVLADAGAAVTVDNAHRFVSAVLAGGHECADAGYSRQTAGIKTTFIGYAPSSIQLRCADPTFGTLSGGGTAMAWLLLVAVVTTDADSPVVAAYPVAYTPDGSLEALFPMPPTGAVAFPFTCPAEP